MVAGVQIIHPLPDTARKYESTFTFSARFNHQPGSQSKEVRLFGTDCEHVFLSLLSEKHNYRLSAHLILVNTTASIERQTRCCHRCGRIIQFQITCSAQPGVTTLQFALITPVRLWDTQRRHLARTFYLQMFKRNIVRQGGILHRRGSYGVVH